ncbi:MAG: carboxyl transferase domain-containing protein [Dehalococcoidia bacterium]|nr:carboxyl transferase domain-containing protein [Dehalococcoidia bacterium]MDD5494540.1 carboxyl transferase domain-containing protein [Dehalococcoidia bacterium]
MDISKILIANRGEVAIRIARAAADLGIPCVAVYPADDARSLHVLAADETCVLKGKGVAAYLDMEQLIDLARETGCDAIHPGYGFLSENVLFARHCLDAGMIFIGPTPELLELCGDKAAARSLARRCDVPLLPGTSGATTIKEAREFFKSLGPGAAVMIKALLGGGGRGIRTVYNLADIDEAFARCQSEARTATGSGDVYVEQLFSRARHIEVQIVGDGKKVVHLGERECTLQRRNQKLIEVAPCPSLSSGLREKITDAALRIARKANYVSLGTFEFLVEGSCGDDADFAFMEVNPRLQVEHTVTEEVTGVDLVRAQIEIAGGRSLADTGLTKNAPLPRGYAIQMRINMETIDEKGNAVAEGGTLSVYEVPSGPGIRVDGYGYNGYITNPSFDSLLAKLIVDSRSPRYEDAVAKAYRALSEFRVEGIQTDIPFLLNILSRPEVARNEIYTRFVEDNAAELAREPVDQKVRYFKKSPSVSGTVSIGDAKVAPEGLAAIAAPMQGCVVEIDISEGDAVTAGQKIVILEAMKMEHVITADRSGYVRAICIAVNDVVAKGDPLLFIEEAAVAVSAKETEEKIDLDKIRPDLAAVIERHALTLDEQRSEAVARRHKKNQRTARENVADLFDPGSFIEYGPLIVAAQRSRRSLDDLMKNTPADGVITGIGTVNGAQFPNEKARCMVLAYDYMVLAGTQGFMSHKKIDRVLRVAHKWRLPIVMFAEGGGGRPGDTDANAVAGLDLTTFNRFGGMSGKAPLIGIVEGPCFAGNAALLGCCDVIIATKSSNIGMGGPAMIEGGGLGVVKPEEIGDINVQTRNGVVDIAVENEAEAVAVTKKYLSYFQGSIDTWEAVDQRRLRWLIPENRLRVYDVRAVIDALADTGSVLELRRHFGPGMVTALIRVEGNPFGLIANDPRHMSGAIEAEDADKAARFMQLCDAHRLPILSLCDTPGFMVGPEIEVRAQVRHVCRMFVVGSHVTVPYFTVVLRKGYGLGAMAMAAGGFHDSFFTASWPTGEFGGMGLEGAVKHGFRKELAAVKDPEERDKLYKFLVEQAYAMGKAMNMASYMEIDSVIDPAETRRWVMRGLKSVPSSYKREAGRSFVDPW